MSTFDDSKPKPYFRTGYLLGLVSTDVKSAVRLLWHLAVLCSVSSIALIVFALVIAIVTGLTEPSYMATNCVVAVIFSFVAVAIGNIIYVINHFDSRISKLEAAHKGRDGLNKPEKDL